MRVKLSWLRQAFFCIAVYCCGLSAQAGTDDLLQRVDLLTANGATQLALRILDSGQPPVEETENWLRAEQARLAIYKKQGDWDALIDRLEHIPAELPLIHQHRIFTHAVEILLRAGRGGQSRRYLRNLIWRGSGDSVQVSHWRRLVIRSYLVEDKLNDAQISMRRYQMEYAPNDQNWSYLFGLTLLKSGAFQQAAARLSSVQNERAVTLRLLSLLRAGVDPNSIVSQAQSLYSKLTSTEEHDAIVMQRLWITQAEAAEAIPDHTLRVKSLEKLFSRPVKPDAELPIALVPVDLWQAYRTLAAEYGNSDNLLVGDSESWLQRAVNVKKKDRYGARSIYALLAMTADAPEQKDEYHGLFYDVLRESDLEYVAVSLYTDPLSFTVIDDIPHSVRHRIVRYAVQKKEIELAARMARNLTTTYAGQNPDEWKLIRARLAIYAGDPESGERLLRELIRPAVRFEPDLANRVMQLLFDLQSVNRHAAAYELLQMMQERVASEQQIREIYFWLGDSLRGMQQYDRAAESYIKSASYAGQGFDMWGQTARYHAAEALTEGGMLEDARKVYEGLLRVTTDPTRAMSLQRKMQDLWLREQETESGKG